MTRKTFMLILRIGFVILLVAIILPVILNYINQPSQEETVIAYNATTVYARVEEIIEEGQITLGEVTQPYQILSIQVLEGPHAGESFQIDFGTRQVRSEDIRIKVGDKILVTVSETPTTGETSAYFTDFERRSSLIWLFLIFCLASVLISGWKGLRSLISILISLFVIIFIILPGIRDGKDPLMITIMGTFLFVILSMYVTYGWTVKTHAAVLGSLLALSITAVLALIFVNSTRMTGFGDENVFYIAQLTGNQLDVRSLLLAGILIGTLGVLDDLVIAQSAAIFELYRNKPELKLMPLFRSAMNIGKDHIAATVNTLFLAYAGASLPMLLLFSFHNINYGLVINIEFIAEEFVRTLVGSLGLFASVPITTFLAALIAVNYRHFGRLKTYLGPLSE